MSEPIRHDGIVLSTDGEQAHVKIVQASACSACHAKSMCMSAESQEKEMDVEMLEPLEVGDNVEVIVEQRMGWKAVVLAYVIPFLILLGVVAIYGQFTENEMLVGGVAIGAIVIYYLILTLFRKKIQRSFSFSARKKI